MPKVITRFFCSKLSLGVRTMNRQNLLAAPDVRSWRELYTAALFETDTEMLSGRIADAQNAIVARARELFNAKVDTIEEDQALDDALYALRALRTCVEMRAA